MKLTDKELSSLWGQGMSGDGAPRSAGLPSSKGFVEGEEVFDPINLRDRIVIKLLFDQSVRIEQIERAWYKWKEQQQEGISEELWRVLARDATLKRETIFSEAARIYAFKTVQLSLEDMVLGLEQVREQFEKNQWYIFIELGLLPVSSDAEGSNGEAGWLFVTHDPVRPEVNKLLRELKLDRFEIQYVSESVMEELLESARSSKNEYLERMNEEGGIAVDLGASFEEKGELVDEDALEAEISRSKLLNLFEAMLIEAVRKGVSDIHIYPNAKRQIEIHFREDGDLVCWHVEGRIHPEAFLAIVKDNAMNVDRFERDAAQDGFVQRLVDNTLIRFRVSVLPLASSAQDIRSESIVIRVLDDRKVILNLRELGLHELALERFEHAIRQPYGMVILTGPTGSGKTTTLYAALQQVASPKRNVLTVEDPVEYILPGVRQIKLNHKLELEGALRAILRHDPDIVMVGEMRDKATAELAIKLANTGHLTFSTLHTNDAPSAVSRLYKMGIEPFLIAYAINLVVAQRLILKLCPACKKPDNETDPVLLQRIGFAPNEMAGLTLYKAGADLNCSVCGGRGFKGRRAITETMLFSPEIRRMIVMTQGMIDEDGLREKAVKEGMLTLQDSARELVRRGETSVMEMMRVVFMDL